MANDLNGPPGHFQQSISSYILSYNKLVLVRHTGARAYLSISTKPLNVSVQAFFATAGDSENNAISRSDRLTWLLSGGTGMTCRAD